MKNTFLIFLCLCSCSHKSVPLNESVSRNVRSCESHVDSLAEESSAEQAFDNVYWLSKNTLAYSYIGLNYTAEVTWDATVGLMHGLVLCAPFMVVSSFAAGDVVLSTYGKPSVGSSMTPAICFPAPAFSKSLFAPPLGRRARMQTQRFRCPNKERVGYLALLRASCYIQRGQAGDQEKALQALDDVMRHKEYSCFSGDLQELLVSNYNQIIIKF